MKPKNKSGKGKKKSKGEDTMDRQESDILSTPSTSSDKDPDKRKSTTEIENLQISRKGKSQKKHHSNLKSKKRSKQKVKSADVLSSDGDDDSDQSDNDGQHKRSKPPTEVMMARELFTAATETLKMAKHIRRLETKIQKLEKKIKADDSSSDDEDVQLSKKSPSTDGSSSDLSEDEPVKKKRKRVKKEKKKHNSKTKKTSHSQENAVEQNSTLNTSVEVKNLENRPQESALLTVSPIKYPEISTPTIQQITPVQRYYPSSQLSTQATPTVQERGYTVEQTNSSVVPSHPSQQNLTGSPVKTAYQYLCLHCGYSVPEERKHELAQHIMECSNNSQQKENAQIFSLQPGVTMSPVQNPVNTSTPYKNEVVIPATTQQSTSNISAETTPVKSVPTPQPSNITTSRIIIPKKAAKTYLQPPSQQQKAAFDGSTNNSSSNEQSGVNYSSPLEQINTVDDKLVTPGSKLTINNYIISSGLEYTCIDCGLVLAKAAKLNHDKVCRKIPICLYCSSHFQSVEELFRHKPECKKKNWQDHPVRKLQHNINIPDSDFMKPSSSKDADKKKMVLKVAKWEEEKRQSKKSSGENKNVRDVQEQPVVHYSQPAKKANVFFVCLKCDQQFASSGELRAHQQEPHLCAEWIKLKSRQKGFKVASRFCYGCKKMFATQNDYTNHRRSCNNLKPEVKTYSCFTCYKQFGSQAELSSHKQLHHKLTESSNCWVCGATFPTFKEFLKHAETHKDVRSNVRKRSRPGHIRDNHHLVLRKETPAMASETENMVSPEVMNMLSQFQQQHNNFADGEEKPGPSFVAEVNKSEDDCTRYSITVDTRGAVQVDSQSSARNLNKTAVTAAYNQSLDSANEPSDITLSNETHNISDPNVSLLNSGEVTYSDRVMKPQLQKKKTSGLKTTCYSKKPNEQPLKGSVKDRQKLSFSDAVGGKMSPDEEDNVIKNTQISEKKIMGKNDNLSRDSKINCASVEELNKLLNVKGINRPVQITTSDPGVQKYLLSLQNQKLVMGGNKIGYVLKDGVKGIPKNVKVKSSKFGDIRMSKSPGVNSETGKPLKGVQIKEMIHPIPDTNKTNTHEILKQTSSDLSLVISQEMESVPTKKVDTKKAKIATKVSEVSEMSIPHSELYTGGSPVVISVAKEKIITDNKAKNQKLVPRCTDKKEVIESGSNSQNVDEQMTEIAKTDNKKSEKDNRMKRKLQNDSDLLEMEDSGDVVVVSAKKPKKRRCKVKLPQASESVVVPESTHSTVIDDFDQAHNVEPVNKYVTASKEDSVAHEKKDLKPKNTARKSKKSKVSQHSEFVQNMDLEPVHKALTEVEHDTSSDKKRGLEPKSTSSKGKNSKSPLDSENAMVKESRKSTIAEAFVQNIDIEPVYKSNIQNVDSAADKKKALEPKMKSRKVKKSKLPIGSETSMITTGRESTVTKNSVQNIDIEPIYKSATGIQNLDSAVHKKKDLKPKSKSRKVKKSQLPMGSETNLVTSIRESLVIEDSFEKTDISPVDITPKSLSTMKLSSKAGKNKDLYPQSTESTRSKEIENLVQDTTLVPMNTSQSSITIMELDAETDKKQGTEDKNESLRKSKKSKKSTEKVSARKTRSQTAVMSRSPICEASSSPFNNDSNKKQNIGKTKPEGDGNVCGILIPVGDNKLKCSICSLELSNMRDVATHKCLIDPQPQSGDCIVALGTTTSSARVHAGHYAKLGKLGKVQMIRSEDNASDDEEGEVDIEFV